MTNKGSFIICTVGTSLLNNLRKKNPEKTPLDIKSALSILRKMESSDRMAGAEINSNEHLFNGIELSFGKPQPPYEIAFLVSDTEDGRLSGELLTAYYKKIREIDSAQFRVVEGLSPQSPKKFAKTGLRNLVREFSTLIKKSTNKGQLQIINATGGFKAQISFAGLIGQTLGVPVVYQFESFNECIEMPPMPVDFDREVWLTNYDVFNKLSSNGVLAETQFPFHEVEPKILHLLDSEYIDDQKLYSLSPILELMHQGFLVRKPPKVSPPPKSKVSWQDKLALVEKELAHDPVGTEPFAQKLARKFDWIERIKNHTPRMNTARTHLLAEKNSISTINICFSDGTLGVKISLKTTCKDEGHLEYAKSAIAEFLEN